ncbi:MAG: acyl-CoA thioesterase [Hydrogenovibrio sp.]|uniref:acyl-CoA thioesterase n=1 Tax=Hydrogenovibrio TaxID=28884 RepID=UPI00037C1267|nr:MULTISPECIES: acyl-CoA thioesterase [Hydrogenovibrio]MDR9499383.1 acyl-CoA thioesterase [Hydrogenovibrio sp.]
MFQVSMQVRDYECDLQGVVNNAVYQNYLEHARHAFLHEQGIDFAALATEGVHLMLIRAELDYKAPLKPNDRFEVTVRMVAEGRTKAVFEQQIVRDDGKLMVDARTIGVNTRNGRPARLPESLTAAFDEAKS